MRVEVLPILHCVAMGADVERAGGWPWGLSIGAVAGTALQLQQPALWHMGVYAAALGLGLVGMATARHRAWAWALALAALAFGLAGLRAQVRLADALPADLEGVDVELIGVIDSLPQPGPLGMRFEFVVESARRAGAAVPVPSRVSLAWFAGDANAAADAAPPPLRAGQRWSLTARLRQPHGNLNPHGFDLELWMFERRLRATGYVRDGAQSPARLLGTARSGHVDRWRQSIRDAIGTRVADADQAGVLAALAVGDQGAIERPRWDLFRDTGVAHLMSISGLHVTLFAWLAGALIGRLWRRSARMTLALPAPAAARWGGLLAAAAYAVLAGWGVPAQRTVGMLAVVVLLQTLGVRWPAPLVLAVAAAAVALGDPWALLQPGFWLSFGGVALLMVGTRLRSPEAAPRSLPQRLLTGALDAGRTQLVVSVGLAPLTVLLFQQVSLVGIAANFVAIPLVTLLIVPLSLLGVIAAPAWDLAAMLTGALIAALEWVARPTWAVWTAAAVSPWIGALGLVGGAVLVLPLPWRRRLLGLPLCVPLLAPAPDVPALGGFELLAVDVGQGTAVIVRTSSRLLLYDSGPRYSPEADAGDRVLLPLLRARGERRIDRLVLSHSDSDHIGGAASLLARLPVSSVTSSLPPQHPLLAGTAPHEPCRRGQRWQWDGVDFEVLHPGEPAAPLRPNALSCVLRVRAADGRSALLAGDIEAAQEGELVVADKAALRSDMLLVPHHGSRTSSTVAFIEAVAPQVAVVQAGYRSRFGHPADDVLARYAERGIRIVRSDRCGAWTWPGRGDGLCQRELGQRYWHDAD